MDSVSFIARLFRRLITRIRGCLYHTTPAVCRHCNKSGGVSDKLVEAARRGHVECVKACLTAGADVNEEGTAQGTLILKHFPWARVLFPSNTPTSMGCTPVQMLPIGCTHMEVFQCESSLCLDVLRM